MVRFAKVKLENGRLVETDVREIKQSDIGKCKFVIFDGEHYRQDGSCKCDDAKHRKMMIKEWGYKAKDFKGIPLRDDSE